MNTMTRIGARLLAAALMAASAAASAQPCSPARSTEWRLAKDHVYGFAAPKLDAVILHRPEGGYRVLYASGARPRNVDDDRAIGFSVDGRRIFVRVGGQAYAEDVRSGTRKPLPLPQGTTVLLEANGLLEARAHVPAPGDGGRVHGLTLIRADGSVLARFPEPRRYQVRASRDGARLLVYDQAVLPRGGRPESGDRSVVVIDSRGKQVARLEAPPYVANAVISPDGRFAATTDAFEGPSTARLWDIASGRELARYTDSLPLRFSADGTTLLLWRTEISTTDRSALVLLEAPENVRAISGSGNRPVDLLADGSPIVHDGHRRSILDPTTLTERAPLGNSVNARLLASDRDIVHLRDPGLIAVHDPASGAQRCEIRLQRSTPDIELLALSEARVLVRNPSRLILVQLR